MDAETGHRLERSWAALGVAHADALARRDPSWGTQVFPVADGWAVLSGRGQYVNRVLGAGLAGAVPASAIEAFEARAAAVGVLPMFDVAELPGNVLAVELEQRGYVDVMSLTAAARSLASAPEPGGAPAVAVEQVAAERLAEWQEHNAVGWGYTVPEARRVSDAFAAARAEAGEHLFLARDTADGRPLGTASLAVADGVATLGGMSTLPDARRRGVQRALVAHRLLVAREAGCDLGASTARSGGDSLRNLLRLGFAVTHTKRILARQVD